MPKWTKKAAIERMEANQLLQEILGIEPRLVPIIEEAKNQQRTRGYIRVQKYVELRTRASLLVGSTAEKIELRTSAHYDVVIQTIGDLLPPDQIDLADD